MSKTVSRVRELTEEERNRFAAISRKLVLATVGAVGVAQDEINTYVNRLVERGEITEKQAQKLRREAAERREKVAKHAELNLDHQLEKILHRANVPTKHDIDALSTKITNLTHRVEELGNQKTHVTHAQHEHGGGR